MKTDWKHMFAFEQSLQTTEPLKLEEPRAGNGSSSSLSWLSREEEVVQR